MSTLDFNMWIGDKKVSLHELLQHLNVLDDINWVMHEGFWVVRDPFNGLTMEDIEKKLRSDPHGYALSYNELDEFARQIRDLNDITLAGFHGKQKAIEIEGFDSSTWHVSTDDAIVDSSQLANFIEGLNSITE